MVYEEEPLKPDVIANKTYTRFVVPASVIGDDSIKDYDQMHQKAVYTANNTSNNGAGGKVKGKDDSELGSSSISQIYSDRIVKSKEMESSPVTITGAAPRNRAEEPKKSSFMDIFFKIFSG